MAAPRFDARSTDAQVTDFLHEIRLADLPGPVRAMAKTCLLDLLAVGAAGSRTPLGQIVVRHATAHFGPGARASHILFDGRRVSPAGAALAGGMTIDAIDAHDGWRPAKGHAGCGLLPSILAVAEAEGQEDGAEFLARLVIGYEVACRAGVALHATVPDYHTSGAWVAVACAGLGARALGLGREATRHALGIAEYHGPRSQMMRVIDHPTMLKDGSGWGAMAGTSAAYLAADGFTGAPAITVEAADPAEHWADLGQRWLILEQYIKPIPVCRWAQPAVYGALALQAEHGVAAEAVEAVEVASFAAAIRLATARPATTEEAQYSLPFPVAAALTRGTCGPEEVTGDALSDPAILDLAGRVEMTLDSVCEKAFPADRLARVALRLRDGRRIEGGPFGAPGDPEHPFSAAELEAKARAYLGPVLGAEGADRLIRAVERLEATGLPGLLAELIPEQRHAGAEGGGSAHAHPVPQSA